MGMVPQKGAFRTIDLNGYQNAVGSANERLFAGYAFVQKRTCCENMAIGVILALMGAHMPFKLAFIQLVDGQGMAAGATQSRDQK